MTTLGKLLLFVNLLAAGGFVYLATQDWKARQDVAAAALRYKLALVGLPLGGGPGESASLPGDPEAEIPFPMDLAGVPVGTVSKAFLDSYFKGVQPDTLLGTGTVPNQLAEV